MTLKKISINILLALVLLVPTISVAQTLQIRTFDIIGAVDPYCGTGGYLETALGLGAEESKCSSINIMEAVANDNITNDVSDWVLLELRAVDRGIDVGSATTGTVVARKPALLLDSGIVVDADKYRKPANCNGNENEAFNCPPVEFDFSNADNNQIINKDLYIVVRHLNHLDVISNERMSTATTTMGTRYSYNFTPLEGGETNAARGGNLGLKIESGMAAMYVGDVNKDANINAADYLQIYRDIDREMDTGITSKESDIDFSGAVDADDVSSQLGENLGRTTQLP